jgi:wobble nucleotide-excising tRNase
MQNDKTAAAIAHIDLNDATFHNQPLDPTLVNFFYGRNGSGKSTIANAIKAGKVSWEPGKGAGDFELRVFDQNYITENFRNKDNVRGVFTYSKEAIADEDKIKAETDALETLAKEEEAKTKELETSTASLSALKNAFTKSCWDKLSNLRREFFDYLLSSYRNKTIPFMEAVAGVAKPKPCPDLEDLKRRCVTAFDRSAKSYSTLQWPEGIDAYKDLDGWDLLGEKITSTGGSEFAAFVKKINATTWISQGRAFLHDPNNADCLCPFCQQAIPEGLEEDLDSCFDHEYQQKLDTIKSLRENYRNHMNQFFPKPNALKDDPFPEVQKSDLSKRLETLRLMISSNLAAIDDKIQNPSKVITVEDTSRIIAEIKAIVEDLNKKIEANNAIIRSKGNARDDCTKEIMAHFASIMEIETQAYKTQSAKLEAEISALTKRLGEIGTEKTTHTSALNTLRSAGIGTTKVMSKINDLLRRSGFNGFHLEEGDDRSSYKVIRNSTGKLAKNLSEGEWNFIAFLYFFYTIQGGADKDNIDKRKIVVIDDPVSSMDGSSLFIVSSLIRQMVEVCCNSDLVLSDVFEGTYIDQMFILTHNVHFHRAITAGMDDQAHYSCVSFYLIRKADENSSLVWCRRYIDDAKTAMENYNPVQNSYATLWSEYKELKPSLMVVNVMRQILDYYFIQLCGYTYDSLRQMLLVKHKDKIVTDTLPDGTPDYAEYNIIYSMLLFMDTSHSVVDDTALTTDMEDRVEQYKASFKRVFEVMDQEQHYNMMMQAVEVKNLVQ